MRTSLAILAAAAALLVVARLVHGPSTPGRVPQPTVGASAQMHLAVPREHDRGTVRTATPLAATRTARRFMAAYLRWQNGRRDPLTVTTLRRASSPQLWHELTRGASLPSRRSSVPVERLRRLVAGEAGMGKATTILAELQAHRAVGSLALVVRRRPEGWRVTSLAP